jgi:hypothetical protein
MAATRRRAQLHNAGLAALLVALATVLIGCGEDDPAGADTPAESIGDQLAASHVHSLAVDPDTDALLIATHDGLFSLDGQLVRVGRLRADLMGFDVADRSSYVASGHPPSPEAGGSPHLGLIASDDGGENWETVSLEGEADFHALAAQGRRVYGYNGLSGELLRSDDRGRGWEATDQIGAVVDLAIDPGDSDRVIASTEEGLFVTENAGVSWESFRGPPGLVAWTSSGIYVFDAFGKVLGADDEGDTLYPVGRLGELPVAVTGIGERLYVATEESEIQESPNRGGSWQPVPIG